MTRNDDHILIHGLVDGALEPDVASALQRRIAVDASLSSEYARVLALKDKLAAMPGAAVSTDFLNRIGGLTQKPVAYTGGWRSMVASVLVTALVSSALTYSLLGHMTGADEADAVAASHRRSLLAASPIDVASSDSHTVKPWLDSHIGISPPAADLKAEGFELLGGRVDVVSTHPVPTLVYRHKEHLISVLAMPLGGKDVAVSAPQHLNAGGMQIVRMSENGFSYWVVSDMEWPALDGFVKDFRAKAGQAAN